MQEAYSAVQSDQICESSHSISLESYSQPYLGDAVVADVEVAEVSHVGEDLPVEAAELVGGEVERLQPRQVEDVALHGVGDQLVAAQVELGQGGQVGEGVPGSKSELCRIVKIRNHELQLFLADY